MAAEPAQWYFDLVSPFSYLHWHGLAALRPRLVIEPVPVLFAGLLKHWGTKGPAELPGKRLHTYQHCVWLAERAGVPFRMPPRHPFNPLSALRLLVALDAAPAAVGAAFEFVFAEGRDPDAEFGRLAERLGVRDPQSVIADPAIKQRLADNTEHAIAHGVFGVPTLVVRGRLFWGNDTVEWTRAYLDDPRLFERPAYADAAGTEPGVARRAPA
jgi:2-hydroxychromene-2-carboxylate isomerase